MKEELRVVVAGADYPNTRLSSTLVDNLQRALERNMNSLPVGDLISNFEGYILEEQEIVKVTCSDDKTKQCLFANIAIITPFENTACRLSEGMPSLGCTNWWPLFLVCRWIRTPCNVTLSTKYCKILGNGARSILGVDGPSYKKITNRGFKAYAEIVKVSFWDPI